MASTLKNFDDFSKNIVVNESELFESDAVNEKFRFTGGSCTSPLCGTVIPSLEKIGNLVADQQTTDDLIEIQAETNKVLKMIGDAIRAATPRRAETTELDWTVKPLAPVFILNLKQRYPQNEEKYHELWYRAVARMGDKFSYGGAINIFKTYCKRENLLLEDHDYGDEPLTEEQILDMLK